MKTRDPQLACIGLFPALRRESEATKTKVYLIFKIGCHEILRSLHWVVLEIHNVV